VSSLTTEPLDAVQFGARELGLRFAVQRRRLGWLLTLAGVALVVGGFAGFGHYTDRNTALQKNGVHATAIVTSTALYGGSYSRNSFTEHIDVQFATPNGVVSGVRIPIGERDTYRVGQQVEISYDPANPHRAVFAHGYADIGWIGFVLFFGIVAGVCVLIYAVRALRLARGARRELDEGARTMQAAIRSVQLRRGRRVGVFLDGPDGLALPLWAAGRDWQPVQQSIETTVFGTATPGSVVVVVDPQRDVATAGRIWKRRRA
jgi:hypothetical protein